jgi:hypothetical protein
MISVDQYFAMSWWQRLLYRKFPPRALPAFKQESLYITGTLVTRLGFVDRLRVLVSGRLASTLRIEVDQPVKPGEMVVATWVLPPGTAIQQPAQ